MKLSYLAKEVDNWKNLLHLNVIKRYTYKLKSLNRFSHTSWRSNWDLSKLVIYLKSTNSDNYRQIQIATNFRERVLSQPKSTIYSTKTINIFSYAFFILVYFTNLHLLQLDLSAMWYFDKETKWIWKMSNYAQKNEKYLRTRSIKQRNH